MVAERGGALPAKESVPLLKFLASVEAKGAHHVELAREGLEGRRAMKPVYTYARLYTASGTLKKLHRLKRVLERQTGRKHFVPGILDDLVTRELKKLEL